MPRALITGITGQDGSYLAELLLGKDYEVHGVVRQGSTHGMPRLEALLQQPGLLGKRLFLHPGDLSDPNSLRRALVKATPDEFYHLAGQTHVGLSFEMVESTCEMTGIGTLRLLEIIRDLPRPPRFFHASSSEIFGRPEAAPQDETTPRNPVTPYGCAKAFATQMVQVYRQRFGLFACNGILYNHESPRRGENFVTRKICLAAAAIKEGRQSELQLGTTSSERDWGDARDYVRGMWLTLQHERPEDFVFATGVLHTVQEVIELAFGAVGLDWRPHVTRDPALVRAEEPTRLVGNAEKARRVLGWEPSRDFRHLITEMTRAGLQGGETGSKKT
jgi:GDPmannose 4,6-dehydratase